MWANRTRKGSKAIEDDRGMKIIEVNDPKEGMMVYRPSSSVMPARPLGVPFEFPIIAPVIKKETEDDEAEAISVMDAVTESSIQKTSQIVEAPNESASDHSIPKLKIKTEPLDSFESSVVKNIAESSPVNKENNPELSEKTADTHEGAKVNAFEKTCGQNSLALWDLESMFPVVSSHIEDKSTPDVQSFKKTYLDYCLDLKKEHVEESIAYLNTSFPNVKRNTLFTLKVPSKKNSTPIDYSASDKKDSTVKCDVSTEALRKILAVSNLPSISPEKTVIIKKEPVSPKKSEHYYHVLNVDKQNTSINSRSDVSVSEVPVAPKISERGKKRKTSEDMELDMTTVIVKKEPVTPEKKISNFEENSKKRKSYFDVEVNPLKKQIKKEPVSDENLASVCCVEKTGPASCNLNAVDKSVIFKVIKATRNEEESNNVVTPKQTMQENKISHDLDSSVSKSKTTQHNRMDVSRVSSLPVIKDTPSLIPQPDNITSVRHISAVNKLSDVDLHATKNYNEKEAVVSVHNSARTVNNALTVNANPDLSPRVAKIQPQISYLDPPPKKRLTPQEYKRRKAWNSSVSTCPPPQASLKNSLDQTPQMGYSESLVRDPRLQKSVTSTSSVVLLGSHNIPSYETGQNVYSCNSNVPHKSFKSSVPVARERPSFKEFKELPKPHQISQCDARSQNVFEPPRGNNSSAMKIVRDKIGYRFINPNDVAALILEWNVSWLEHQKRLLIVPPIIRDGFSYPEVKNLYDSVESYYNTYLPLHLLNIWMSIYKSWERHDFLPDSFYEGREEKPTYVKICCSMRLNLANKNKLPKSEDILICHIDGHHKKLFGKVVGVREENIQSSLLGSLGDTHAYIDIICAENFDVNTNRPIKLQRLNNIRISLNVCRALKYINSFMRSAILDPKHYSSQLNIISARPFISATANKSNTKEIMESVKSRDHSITVVDTTKPSDSLKAITFIVPEVVSVSGLIFICMKEEETFFQMAIDLSKYNPVLAVKEEDVPRLPNHLVKFTIKRRPEMIDNCNVVLTLMSAMFIGELDKRLRNDSLEEGKNAICLIYEAQKFLETETALLLEHSFKSVILLGRKGMIEDMEARLKRQSFDKSLFFRIFDSHDSRPPM